MLAVSHMTLDYDNAREHDRHHLLVARLQAQASWDKTVLWLSAGTVALSITFVNSCTSAQLRLKFLLGCAWFLLAVSLILILFSFASARKAYDRAIRQHDALEVGTPGGIWSYGTDALNVLGTLACVIGISLVLLFSFLNLGALDGR
jgi:hypothetical protein